MTSTPMASPLAARRLEASDARADESRRVVFVDRDRVVIARSFAGVFMRIALTPSAYRGVLLRLAALDETGFHYEVRLAHDDPDFGVMLAEFDDEAEAHAEWGQWSRFLQLPPLVERTEGVYEPARPTIGGGVASGSPPRRRGRGLRMRRARFLTRRKVGRPELCVLVEAEQELFGGWRPE